MDKRLAVLVTGATGTQGGATARLLVKKGHRVRALARDTASAKALALSAAGIELVQGDLDDRASLDRALAGMEAMFLVLTPFVSGAEAETRQGTVASDAAKAAGVYVVYSSVANADRKTGIPHFDSKFVVEKHMRDTGLDAAIIAPAYFMDNLFYGLPQLRQGIFGSPLAPAQSLKQVAVSNIAATAVAALEHHDKFAGRRYDLAGDDLSGEREMAILSQVTGRTFTYFRVPMEGIRASMGEDGVKMYEWFESTGYSVDRDGLRRDFPDVPWLSFEAWARTLDWTALLGG